MYLAKIKSTVVYWRKNCDLISYYIKIVLNKVIRKPVKAKKLSQYYRTTVVLQYTKQHYASNNLQFHYQLHQQLYVNCFQVIVKLERLN